MKCIGLILVLLSWPAGAISVYKWTDVHGGVHFSDKPHDGSETIELPEGPSAVVSKTEPLPKQGDREPMAVSLDYDKIAIAQPEDQATIRNTEGYVPVVVTLSPILRKDDKVQIILDGKAVGVPQKGTVFGLKNLLRGAHTLAAAVSSPQGQIQKTSQPITIYMMPPRVGMVPHNP